MFFVYVLRSLRTGRYYAGSTENVPARLLQHNVGKSPSTRAAAPWELLHTERFPTRSAALAQERRIKARGIERYLKSLPG